jgi:hypothetical protein
MQNDSCTEPKKGKTSKKKKHERDVEMMKCRQTPSLGSN